MHLKYFIIAGESSGDLHGGHLMREMKSINPKVTFQGIGGNLMTQNGLKSFVDINKINILYFTSQTDK